MQYVVIHLDFRQGVALGAWRCPWASTERWAAGKRTGVVAVTCQWPLDERREIEGLPNGVTE